MGKFERTRSWEDKILYWICSFSRVDNFFERYLHFVQSHLHVSLFEAEEQALKDRCNIMSNKDQSSVNFTKHQDQHRPKTQGPKLLAALPVLPIKNTNKYL